MKQILQEFLLMVQFFTRIPIHRNLPCESSNFRRGVLFLPLIGLIIGASQYTVAYVLKNYLTTSIIASIVVILPIVLTGGLHIDGLGDTCDGFFACKGDKEGILQIMKDSSSGTYAVCAIVSNILLQYVSVQYILEKDKLGVLFVIIMFCKVFVLFTAMWGKPAKKFGSGNIFIGNMSMAIVLCAVVYSFFISVLVIPIIVSLKLLASGAVASVLFYFLCQSKIDGITGDTLGATQEIATIIMLITYCIII